MAEFTKYEMALMQGEMIVLALGFTERRTKQCLFQAMLANGPKILEAADWNDDSGEFVWNAADKSFDLPTGHKVRFTGRTAKTIN